MSIQLSSTVTFRSINAFEEITLPDFVVITGVNGSGKSHLLNGISTNNTIHISSNGAELIKKKIVNSASLAPSGNYQVTQQDILSRSQNVLNIYQNYKKEKERNPSYTVEQAFSPHRNLFKTVTRLASTAGKHIEELESNDFYDSYPLADGLDEQDIFYQNFSFLFKHYHTKYLDNKFAQFMNASEGGAINFLTHEQFVAKYGEAPWNFVNKILQEANLGYHVISPEKNLNRDAPFELKLISDTNGIQIMFDDLSSGEKVLMSLALSIYNSTLEDIDFPQVLLMDEPDGPLHPSMAKQFLDVIQNVFVKEKGVKVIITTHSASTVALAPEEAIYIMNKTSPRLEKSTKDKALKVLTAGVPSLSINYENRKQVFVESKYDASIYDKTYTVIKQYLEPEISLSFISSGKKGVGSCSQVVDVVTQLHSFGNHDIFGIIDRDSNNKESEKVFILGTDQRYSIENYLFDPVVIAAFLLKEKMISKHQVGLSNEENYIDIRNFEGDRLQVVVDKFIPLLNDASLITTNTRTCYYLNDKSVDIPTGFLETNGHELETKLKQVFPELNKYHQEGDLKLAIIDHVFEDMHAIIPKDFVLLFTKIQNN